MILSELDAPGLKKVYTHSTAPTEGMKLLIHPNSAPSEVAF